MSAPRILFVNRYHVLRETGGTEEQCLLLSEEFARRGWDAHYASEMNTLPDPPVINGVTLHGLPENPSPWRGNRRPLRELMFALQPHVVYNQIFNFYTAHCMLDAPRGTFKLWAPAAMGDGFLLAKLRQLKPQKLSAGYLLRLPLQAYQLYQAQRGVRAADLVLAQRQEQVVQFEAAGLRCMLLRNTQAPVPAAEIQTHDGKPVVLWAGSVKQIKRPEMYVELARRCRDLDAQFLMIGAFQEEHYRAQIEAAARELPNFRYGGFVPLARVGEAFRQAHIFVNTSTAEGYPTTFIQAWQREIPVASLGVNPEGLVTERDLGVVGSTMDELAVGVRNLLASPSRRRQIGARARAWAAEAYEVGPAVDRLEDVLRRSGVPVPPRL